MIYIICYNPLKYLCGFYLFWTEDVSEHAALTGSMNIHIKSPLPFWYLPAQWTTRQVFLFLFLLRSFQVVPLFQTHPVPGLTIKTVHLNAALMGFCLAAGNTDDTAN